MRYGIDMIFKYENEAATTLGEVLLSNHLSKYILKIYLMSQSCTAPTPNTCALKEIRGEN